MRLTTFTDYTIRVLIYMGIYPDCRISTSELAVHYGISRNHLNKVAHYLGQQGYVDTSRGKGGGMSLARSPEDINIGTLVRDTEKNSVLVECFDATHCQCRILPACRLMGMLHEAQEAFYYSLEQYSLADLIVDKTRLHNVFGASG